MYNYEQSWKQVKKSAVSKLADKSHGICRVLGLTQIDINVPIHIPGTWEWRKVTPIMALRNDILAERFLFGVRRDK